MSKTDNTVDFSAGLKELEAIATWFETGDIDLDQGLKKFERGMELSGELKKHLTQMQNQVEKVKARFDGQPKTDSGEEPTDPNLFEL